MENLSCHRFFKHRGIDKGHLYQFQELESTNVFARDHVFDLHHGDVIWAIQQTQGKGRQGRIWISHAHQSLTFTIFIQKPIEGLWLNLSQIAAMALCDLLKQYEIKANIKWPNDVLVGRKKISGILLESLSTPPNALLLGLGINVNCDDSLLYDIKPPATSVKKEIHMEISLSNFLGQYISYLESYLDLLISHGFSAFREKWESYSNLLGKEIQIDQGGKKKTVQVTRFLSDGALEVIDGKEKKVIYSGEVFL